MTIRSNLTPFFLLGCSVVGTAWVHAEEVLPWSVSVTEENDKFTPGNKDRYYTQGLKVAINRPDDIFFSIAQEINTPSDTVNPPSVLPPYTDLPYSGALYLGAGFGRVFERGGRRDVFFALEAKLGVIGPSAGGETVQNKFHQLIGTAQAVGWGTQLPDEILMKRGRGTSPAVRPGRTGVGPLGPDRALRPDARHDAHPVPARRTVASGGWIEPFLGADLPPSFDVL